MEALGINGWLFFSQLVTFLIVILVLAKWAFPLVTKTLDDRARLIQEGVDNTFKSRAELEAATKRVEAMLEEARQEGQRSLARANQAAEHMRTEIEQEAQARARDIMTQAERRIQQEMAQARAELSQQVVDLAIMAAGRVVGHSLDTADNRRLVNEFVAQSRDLQC